MTVYEVYASAKEKRFAQRGAKLGKPTGKASGYIFVYNESRGYGSGNCDAIASVFDVDPGDDNPRGNLGSTSVELYFLREKCRRIGGCRLPPKWKERWEYYRKPWEEQQVEEKGKIVYRGY
jgi:hypothetical protein